MARTASTHHRRVVQEPGYSIVVGCSLGGMVAWTQDTVFRPGLAGSVRQNSWARHRSNFASALPLIQSCGGGVTRLSRAGVDK
jgi:hypothetical protein